MNDIIKTLNTLYANNLYYLSPKNIRKEQKKFLAAHEKAKEYNPQFIYPIFPKELKPYRVLLSQVTKIKTPYKNIASRYIEKTKALINMLGALQKNKDIKQADSRTFYGFPSTKAVSYARSLMQKEGSWKKKKVITHSKVRKELEKAIEPFGWTLEEAMMPSKAKVIMAKKVLVINPHAKFSEKDVRRLIVHEVHAHIQRGYNHGKMQFPLKDMFDGTEIEEGLAYYMEEQEGVHSFHQTRIYAARLWAVYNNKKSFFELFTSLKKYGFSDYMAYTIATRVKRGVHDTKKPGGLTKDHTYLSGKLKVEQYIKRGGKLEDLLQGRYTIRELPVVNKFI